MAIALIAPGGSLQWEADRYPEPMVVRRALSAWRVAVLCGGLVLTAIAVAGAWFGFGPATEVHIRIVADGSSAAGRAALAEAALRIGTAPGRSAVLDPGGDTIVLTVADDDPFEAWRRARSLADTLLDLPVPPRPAPSTPIPAERPLGNRAALLADRTRLLANADATDARIASVSASLTALTRDLASNVRAAADRKVPHDTLDKAAAALADLQLQRIQLATRYQDDYPAVVALDGQIRTLRGFLQDETRRVDAATHALPADPADPILTGERDRLRTELFQLNDRRVSIAADLATVGRSLAATPADPVVAPAAPAFVLPAAMLVEASTTVSTGFDPRWFSLPAVLAAGLLLSLAAWFMPRRQSGAPPTEMLLRRLEAIMLPRVPTGALPSDGAAALDPTLRDRGPLRWDRPPDGTPAGLCPAPERG